MDKIKKRMRIVLVHIFVENAILKNRNIFCIILLSDVRPIKYERGKIMLRVASEPMELRGVATNTTKNGKTYYVVNAETEDGTPHQFYCPDFNALPQGLSKGEMVRLYFHVRRFDRQERLEVCKVEKVG